MKQAIRLTESDLNKIVKESVNKVLNETTNDTLDSAIYAANNKVRKYADKYGENSEATNAARSQRKRFQDEYLKRYTNANQRTKGRMEKNRKDRLDGSRKYINGVGWRTDVNESVGNVGYEKLYDEIQNTTNNINNFCGFSIMNDSTTDKYTMKLMEELQDLASKLSNVAHELEEHLAWD